MPVVQYSHQSPCLLQRVQQYLCPQSSLYSLSAPLNQLSCLLLQSRGSTLPSFLLPIHCLRHASLCFLQASWVPRSKDVYQAHLVVVAIRQQPTVLCCWVCLFSCKQDGSGSSLSYPLLPSPPYELVKETEACNYIFFFLCPCYRFVRI